MADKALTVAIAGALAAPMAAQAVDFTISGHVNRALFLTDTEAGDNPARVQDNSGSGTRIRVTGSSEIEGGNTVGIQFEYGAGSSLSLRHANVQYTTPGGRITLGRGSEAGDGSAYTEQGGVFGIGHGAGTPEDFKLAQYFDSLDGGERTEMIRYDTPSLGGFRAAASLANDDRVSGLLAYSGDFGGATFGAQFAALREIVTLREANKNEGVTRVKEDRQTIGASFGVTMASGFFLSGAWAKGSDFGIGDKASGSQANAIARRAAKAEVLNDTRSTRNARNANSLDLTDERAVNCFSGAQGGSAWKLNSTRDGFDGVYTGEGANRKLVPASVCTTDPSYWQMEVGYKFGNSAVAASWYQSKDMDWDGSKGTALGVGIRHTLPKAGADLYAAVQNYEVERWSGAGDVDETVYVVGSRVKF